MEGKFTEDSFPFQMMSDYYKLVKEFWEVEEGQEYWTKAIDRAEEFRAKYENQSLGFSGRLAMEYLNYLERKYYQDKESIKES